ncbi:MAG: phosphatase domain-containing protein, partial [Bdellovibrio sp.]
MDRYFVKTILLIVFLLSACFSGKASAAALQNGSDKTEVILISDIDDTIENSHVRAGDKLRSLGHVLNYHDDFFGMSLLYRALAENGVRVVYVSGMPKLLDKVTGGATNFLRDNSFPGEEILRNSTDEDTYTFKVRTITAYLEDLQQKEPNKKFHVIAPGDNGEQDIRVLDT